MLRGQFSACQVCDAVRAAAYSGEKYWEGHESHTLDMIYPQTALTDIRQIFLHVINTNKCCVGRSGSCRLVTTVYSEFINLQSKSKFTRVGISESSSWTSPKPHQTWCPEWDEMKFSDSNEFRVFKQRTICLEYYTVNETTFIFSSVVRHFRSSLQRWDQQSLWMPQLLSGVFNQQPEGIKDSWTWLSVSVCSKLWSAKIKGQKRRKYKDSQTFSTLVICGPHRNFPWPSWELKWSQHSIFENPTLLL